MQLKSRTDRRTSWHRSSGRAGARLLALTFIATATGATAQDTTGGWNSGQAGTTTIQRTSPDEASASTQVRLVALLTADGQRIDNGIIWHVFQSKAGADGKSKLVNTFRDASPTVKLEPGDYVVNAAFGRAHLTRKISVKPTATPAIEQFVINAGGLRVNALVGDAPAPANSVTYEIQSDRDQSDTRKTVMSGARPGLVIRLNSGIYHIVSTYGDANATVESDVTVEAGKLTEAQISHSAAKATFKLVSRQGGEALSDTQWTIQTKDGRVVKESVGALPSHILAPGEYMAVARSLGKSFTNSFTLKAGETAAVEVIATQTITPQ